MEIQEAVKGAQSNTFNEVGMGAQSRPVQWNGYGGLIKGQNKP